MSTQIVVPRSDAEEFVASLANEDLARCLRDLARERYDAGGRYVWAMLRETASRIETQS